MITEHQPLHHYVVFVDLRPFACGHFPQCNGLYEFLTLTMGHLHVRSLQPSKYHDTHYVQSFFGGLYISILIPKLPTS